MATYSFGSGALIGVRTDVANATPVNFGLIQEVSIEDSADIKELYGQYNRAQAVARGKVKTTCKAKVAKISGLAFSNFYYGIAPVAGQITTQFEESGTVPGTPFAITVANAANFVDDLGVFAGATGLPLRKVASTPAVGEYSVAAGVYTFNTADTTKVMKITYTYSISGTGQKIVVANQFMGAAPYFQAQFYTIFQGQAVSLKLHSCVANKLNFASKLDDFLIPEFEFSCQPDAAGNVMTWSFSEAS